MAKQVVQQRRVSIGVACAVFGIGEPCHRYQAKLNLRIKPKKRPVRKTPQPLSVS